MPNRWCLARRLEQSNELVKKTVRLQMFNLTCALNILSVKKKRPLLNKSFQSHGGLDRCLVLLSRWFQTFTAAKRCYVKICFNSIDLVVGFGRKAGIVWVYECYCLKTNFKKRWKKIKVSSSDTWRVRVRGNKIS